ncbi:phosphoadenylyl-sulfate reductase [alpha proteobacterium U9-1i]|nr:phosphoadenylyl-sulfate reductase [alpha proteobacterium U9-1i]
MSKLWRPPEAPWTEERETLAQAGAALLRRIADAHPTAAIATSLQAEDAVLTDLAFRAGAKIDLVTLNTGRLPQETLAAKTALEQRYGVEIAAFAPDREEILNWIVSHGADGFYESEKLRHECCAIRKVKPLARALEGRTAWVTGQRRAQAATRTELAEHEFDATHGIEKFNPIAAWSQDDVWAYIARHDVPVNALYARGYASIGCDPCTRAIRADEDVRAGRWWWERSQSKECGLHVVDGALASEGQLA